MLLLLNAEIGILAVIRSQKQTDKIITSFSYSVGCQTPKINRSMKKCYMCKVGGKRRVKGNTRNLAVGFHKIGLITKRNLNPYRGLIFPGDFKTLTQTLSMSPAVTFFPT